MDKLDMFEDASGSAMPAAQAGGRRRRNMTRKNRRNMARKNTRRNNNSGMEMMGGAKLTVGTKAQVWHGTAKHTSGGLTKKDLMKHKGKIVSRRKHAAGLKAIKRLRKLGYTAKKGKFSLFKKH
jgi:hypothetical protein